MHLDIGDVFRNICINFPRLTHLVSILELHVYQTFERDPEHVVEVIKENSRRRSEIITRRLSRGLNIYPSYLAEVHLRAHKPHAYSSYEDDAEVMRHPRNDLDEGTHDEDES